MLVLKWVDEGKDPFVIGIGLNFGETIFGQMGSEGKQELTVIGDPVNQAARLEGLTKKFAARVIIGEEVADFVGQDFRLRHLGGIRTKGKSGAASLYSVVARVNDTISEEGKSFLERYDIGLEAFRDGRIEEAKEAFESCLKTRPGDVPSKLYLDEIEYGTEGGVLVMRDK